MQPLKTISRSLGDRYLASRRKRARWRKCAFFEVLESRALLAANVFDNEITTASFITTTGNLGNTNVVSLSSANANLDVAVSNSTEPLAGHNDIGDQLVVRVASRGFVLGGDRYVRVTFDSGVVVADGMAVQGNGVVAQPTIVADAPNVLTYDLSANIASPAPISEESVLEIPFRVTGDGEPEFIVSLASSTVAGETSEVFDVDDNGPKPLSGADWLLSDVFQYRMSESLIDAPQSVYAMLLADTTFESGSLSLSSVNAFASVDGTVYVTPARPLDGWPMPAAIVPSSPNLPEMPADLPFENPPEPPAGMTMMRFTATNEDASDQKESSRETVNWYLSSDASWNRYRLLEVDEGGRRRGSSRLLTLASRLLDSAADDQSLIARAINENGDASTQSVTIGLNAFKRRLLLSGRISRLIEGDSEESPRIVIITPEDYDAVLAAWGQSESTAEPKKEMTSTSGE